MSWCADGRAVLCIEHIICLGVMTASRGVPCIEHIICLGVMTASRGVPCIEHIICLGVMTVEVYHVLSTLYVLV